MVKTPSDSAGSPHKRLNRLWETMREGCTTLTLNCESTRTIHPSEADSGRIHWPAGEGGDA